MTARGQVLDAVAAALATAPGLTVLRGDVEAIEGPAALPAALMVRGGDDVHDTLSGVYSLTLRVAVALVCTAADGEALEAEETRVRGLVRAALGAAPDLGLPGIVQSIRYEGSDDPVDVDAEGVEVASEWTLYFAVDYAEAEADAGAP